jgi:hypothetical protein
MGSEPVNQQPWLWAKLKRLVYDENYASQKVRAVVGVIGTGVAIGVIPLPVVPDNTSGWWYVTRGIGLVLMGCAWWVRAGDRTLVTLAATPDAELHAVGVATTTPKGA